MTAALPIAQFQQRDGVIDLAWGHPAPGLLPVQRWQEASAAAARTVGWQALTYGWPAGPGPLLEWLGEHLAGSDGRAAGPSELLVTAGTSVGLDLVTSSLTAPGDVVVVHSPTYHLGLRILQDHGVRLVPAVTDQAGLDPAGTGELIRRLTAHGDRVPMIYLVPTFANPTGATLTVAQRRAVADLAAATGVTVIEDDPYRELWYDAGPPPSIWSLAGDAPVIRLGTFSKTVAPGVRLGWVAAGPGSIALLAGRGVLRSGGGMNPHNAAVMASFAASGGYAEHVAMLRAAYRERRDALIQAVLAHAPGAEVTAPAGGWFLWAGLPGGVTAAELTATAEELGVSCLPGDLFFVGQASQQRVRLAFSRCDPAEFDEGARRLGLAIEKCRPA